MKNKILSNLSFFFCAALGHLALFFFALPYAVGFYEVEGFAAESATYPLSGYEVMSEFWDLGFCGVMSALLQILILLTSLTLLVYGVFAVLKVFLPIRVLDNLYENRKLPVVALIVYAGLQTLLFFFMIILSIVNTETESGLGYKAQTGIRLGAGLILSFLFAIGCSVASIILQNKFSAAATDNQPKVVYLCSSCGKKAKKGMNFCPDCGAPIEEKFQGLTKYLCASCGREVKEGTNFCSDCGGKIEAKEMGTVQFLCSACGTQVTEGTKFCPTCGGQVAAKLVTENPPAPEATPAPVPTITKYLCTSCGKELDENAKFCPDCGGKVEGQTF